MKFTKQRARLVSYSPHWRTPPKIYEELAAEFGFNLDPCPNGGSDGLTMSWQGKRVYCNPPYGPRLGEWIAKWMEADVAIYLVPARTDTEWFARCLNEAREIRFIRGRLRFGTGPHNAPFPSCVLVFAVDAALVKPL